ncbi:MAG: DEAD/DEAH box helicase family protein [Patescibacteria group bacterium]|nr:DEAD/DEAH box helicase family protein [Patescibacteria group bacterium]
MIDIVLDNRLRIPLEGLPANVVSELRLEFQHRNPDYWKAKSRGFYARNIPQHISTWKNEDGHLSLPRGGWKRVKSILVAKGIQYRVIDRRSLGEAISPPAHLITPYDYQERCISTALEKENCIIKSPTGSGKSTMCLALASRLPCPTLIIVNSSRLLDQWVKRTQSEMNFEAGVIQGKNFDLKPVTIAMQQTLWRLSDEKWETLNKYFGAVVADEVDLFAANTFIKAIDRFTCKYRIGVSADHTRKDGKHFLLHDVFGNVCAEVTKEELIERKFVLDVEVEMMTTDFEAQWYRNQQTAYRMRMAGESHAAIYEELLKYNPDMKPEEVPKGNPDYNQLIDEMIVDEGRNRLILAKAQELVLSKKRTIILTERVDHCKYLADQLRMMGISCGLLIGEEENAEEFQACINGLASGTIAVGVGTRHAFGRGIDVPAIDEGIIATVVHTNKQLFGQIRGRMCRTAPGKTQARLWYLYDREVFGNAPVKNLTGWNRVCKVDGISSKEWMK